jgi:hypothetical protein
VYIQERVKSQNQQKSQKDENINKHPKKTGHGHGHDEGLHENETKAQQNYDTDPLSSTVKGETGRNSSKTMDDNDGVPLHQQNPAAINKTNNSNTNSSHDDDDDESNKENIHSQPTQKKNGPKSKSSFKSSSDSNGDNHKTHDQAPEQPEKQPPPPTHDTNNNNNTNNTTHPKSAHSSKPYRDEPIDLDEQAAFEAFKSSVLVDMYVFQPTKLHLIFNQKTRRFTQFRRLKNSIVGTFLNWYILYATYTEAAHCPSFDTVPSSMPSSTWSSFLYRLPFSLLFPSSVSLSHLVSCPSVRNTPFPSHHIM